MLLVISPRLALELASRQVLLVSSRLVVEGVEQGFCLQLLKELRIFQDGNLGIRIRVRHAIGHKA